MSVSVEKKPFGVTKGGEAVNIYCIKNDMLAVEIARRAHCTALKYDSFRLQKPQAAQRHRESAARATVPVCARCGARMVLRTAQKGARKGQRFWGCSNYPVCRYTQEYEDGARK